MWDFNSKWTTALEFGQTLRYGFFSLHPNAYWTNPGTILFFRGSQVFFIIRIHLVIWCWFTVIWEPLNVWNGVGVRSLYIWRWNGIFESLEILKLNRKSEAQVRDENLSYFHVTPQLFFGPFPHLPRKKSKNNSPYLIPWNKSFRLYPENTTLLKKFVFLLEVWKRWGMFLPDNLGLI